MKHFSLRGILAAVGLTAILTVSAGAASLGTATVDADALRLRASADSGSVVLSMAYKGDKVEVLQDAGNGWYKVSLDGVTGYMSGEYLKASWKTTATPAAATVNVPQQAVPTAASPASGNVKVDLGAGEVLNLRSGPSSQSSKLASIPGGTVLALEESSGGWYKVTYNGTTGYVSSEYVVATNEAVGTVAPASNSAGSSIVALAKQYIGCPYVYGASGPRAFDCSGFTSYIYRQMGISIPRGASSQYRSGTPVSTDNLQPGDLVFISDPAFTMGYPVSHVGIYIGGGQFIHASSNRGEGVTISSIFSGRYGTYYAGARRYM